jgi:hypothetical protein
MSPGRWAARVCSGRPDLASAAARPLAHRGRAGTPHGRHGRRPVRTASRERDRGSAMAAAIRGVCRARGARRPGRPEDLRCCLGQPSWRMETPTVPRLLLAKASVSFLVSFGRGRARTSSTKSPGLRWQNVSPVRAGHQRADLESVLERRSSAVQQPQRSRSAGTTGLASAATDVDHRAGSWTVPASVDTRLSCPIRRESEK